MCLLFTVMVKAQSADEKAVTAQVESLRKAMVDADRGALNGLISENLNYGHSSGLIDTKASFIETTASKKTDYITIEQTDQTVKIVDGNIAIVRLKLTGTTTVDNAPGTLNLLVLMVWHKEGGQWKLLARHAAKAV